MLAAQVDDIFQISEHESYHGWPTITRRKSGELLVVASAGRLSHVCPFGQIHLLRSDDEGSTWRREVVASTSLDDRDCGVLETGRGTLLVNWFTSVAWLHRLWGVDADPGKRLAVGNAHGVNISEDLTRVLFRKMASNLTEQTLADELSPWLIRSEDGGKTWSDRINPQVGAPHGPTELSDGRLLYVGNAKFAAGQSGRHGSPYAPGLAVSESTDDGKTWSIISTIPVRDGDVDENYHEPHVVQAADGRVIVHIRNHNEQDQFNILQCESADNGHSWTSPWSLGQFGFPNHLLRLADGRLLSTYSYRRPPSGNRVIVSSDNGASWSDPMTLSAEGLNRDLGYPSTAELPDGTLLSVWYEYMHHLGYAIIRMARWRLVG